MSALLRDVLWFAAAGCFTWFLFLRPVSELPGATPRSPEMPIPVALTPLVTEPSSPTELAALDVTEEPPPRSELEDEELAPSEPAPPPPELGTPEGSEDVESSALSSEPTESETAELEPAAVAQERAAEVAAEEDAAGDVGPTVDELMADPELLEAASAEISGEARQGFATVLLAAPEEQLDIASLFGEELVLVPRSALDPEVDTPSWFRVATDGSGGVERIATPPPLENYRQYRDLFDYEYARLPESLRTLRRSVLARNEIYLFAALIPVGEWALIIARRTAALELSGRELTDVRRFVLRYMPTLDGGFDLRVEEILFADGSRFLPAFDLENSD